MIEGGRRVVSNGKESSKSEGRSEKEEYGREGQWGEKVKGTRIWKPRQGEGREC